MNQDIVNYIDRWRNEGSAGPYTINILPTDICNLHCKSCWRIPYSDNADLKSYEIPDKRIIELIEEAGEIGTRIVQISGGGEPLMRKETLILIMEKIKTCGMEGELISNGTLFTSELIDFLVDIRWNKVTISLDGPNAFINDYLRPPEGSFNRIIRTFELFRIAKEKKHVSLPNLIIHCVISNVNFDKITEMVNLAITYKIEGVFFDFVRMESPFCKPLIVNIKEMHEILVNQINIAQRIAQRRGIWNNLAELFNTITLSGERAKSNAGEIDLAHSADIWSSLYCYHPWFYMLINVKGEVSPCCLFPAFKENIKEKSLKEVWFSEGYSSLRNSILDNSLPSICRECNASMQFNIQKIRGFLGSKINDLNQFLHQWEIPVPSPPGKMIENELVLNSLSQITFSQGADILDVACGGSPLPIFLAKAGYKVSIIDRWEEKLFESIAGDKGLHESLKRKLCPQHYEIMKGDFLTFDFQTRRFDAILSISALEHFTEKAVTEQSYDTDTGDIKAVEKIGALLKIGGIAVITLPFHQNRRDNEDARQHGNMFERWYNEGDLKARIINPSGLTLVKQHIQPFLALIVLKKHR